MTVEHDALRTNLGPVGAWTFAFDSRSVRDLTQDAVDIQNLGYPTLWIPEGGGSRDVLTHLGLLLAATDRLTVASGIANITARQPEVLEAGLITLADAYGDRLVPGIGIGHEYTTESRGVEWSKPLARMRTYLDRMDGASDRWPAPAVPPRRMLAALGDGMLRLSAERAFGAHTYFVPVEHTARARQVLGPEPVLAVEQGVILAGDPARAHELARGWAKHYLELPNYANNWRRMGYGDDLDGGGSDRLVDAAIAWGGVDSVLARVRAHLDAGADHVCVQIVGDADDASPVPALRELAPALLALQSDTPGPAELAATLRVARDHLVQTAERNSNERWTTVPEGNDQDLRPVNVLVDHVADAYEYIGGWVRELVGGSSPSVDAELIDRLNSEHSARAANVTGPVAIEHLTSAGDAFIEFLRTLELEHLDLEGGRVRRFAEIVIRHTNDHRVQIEGTGLGG